MSEEPQKSPGQTAANAIGTAVNAAKAAGRAAAGDIAGAAVQLLKDRNVRIAIIATVVLLLFSFAFLFLAVGAAIIGTIIALAENWKEAYDEEWRNQGIRSDGNALYLYTIGGMTSFITANGETLDQFFEGLFDLFHTDSTGGDATNADIGGTNVKKESYQTTLDSVKDEESLVGENGAIMERLDMIKTRVRQRGDQICEAALGQYVLEVLGLTIGGTLASIANNNPYLYAGIDYDNSGIHVDATAFALTDLQALKILAAYSVQHDCALASADMWDLMDYCGWYTPNILWFNNEHSLDTIYNSTAQTGVYQDLCDVVTVGDTTVCQLSPLDVPKWDGTCAEQWYYEEIAQLKKYKEEYDAATINSPTLHHIPSTSSGELDISAFDRLKDYETYGIIDLLFTATNATLSITRTDYYGIDEVSPEFFSNQTCPDWLRSMWNEINGGEAEKDSSEGWCRVHRTEEGEFYVTVSATSEDGQFYIGTANTTEEPWVSDPVPSTDGCRFDDLKPDTEYNLFLQEKLLDENGVQIVINGVPQWTTYRIDNFSTVFPNASNSQAYQLRLNVDVTFTSRSVDELATNILGLWPGDLQDVVETSPGVEYAKGHEGDPKYLRTWTDTYIADNGRQETITLERQSGYQQKYFRDYIQSMATELGYETTGLFEPVGGNGQTIVQVALAEYEYYTANNLNEGNRYWEKINNILGYTMWNQAWCVAFVQCCAYDCGYIVPGGCFGDYGGTGTWPFWCGGIKNGILEYGDAELYTTPDYIPSPGDLIFFDHQINAANPSHVGIVEYVDEAGQVHTIEGNSGPEGLGKVKRKTYSSYSIGTFVYPAEGHDVYICSYLHIFYPASYPENPKYLTVGGTYAPYLTARNVGNTLIAGMPRFRREQLHDVVTKLKDEYPELYTEALQTALDGGDMGSFISAWNAIAYGAKQTDFRKAQMDIAAQLYVQPLKMAVQKETGFDFAATETRQEILWALATTTSNMDAAAMTLKYATRGLENNITDEDLLKHLNSTLGNAMIMYQSSLWAGETHDARTAWINSVKAVLLAIQNEGAAS